MFRHHHGLLCRHLAQGPPVQMIKMSVGDKDRIDGGKGMKFNSRFPQALDHLEPARPIGINEQVDPRGLQEKRGMSDPGQ